MGTLFIHTHNPPLKEAYIHFCKGTFFSVELIGEIEVILKWKKNLITEIAYILQ